MFKAILPSSWACALVNRDWSGYSKEEIKEIKEWMAKNNLPEPLSCADEYVGTYNGLITMVCDYYFPGRNEDE